MTYITSVLLTVAILFISYGVSIDNLIDTIIGSACAGLYNGIKNWGK
jgi:hypothetical protein